MKKRLVFWIPAQSDKRILQFPEALDPQILHSAAPELARDPKGNSAATLKELLFKTVN